MAHTGEVWTRRGNVRMVLGEMVLYSPSNNSSRVAPNLPGNASLSPSVGTCAAARGGPDEPSGGHGGQHNAPPFRPGRCTTRWHDCARRASFTELNEVRLGGGEEDLLRG